MGYLASAGSALLSNPTALLTAAGVAWGIFETLQGGRAGAGAAGGAGLRHVGRRPASRRPARPPSAPLPPLPAVGASGGGADERRHADGAAGAVGRAGRRRAERRRSAPTVLARAQRGRAWPSWSSASCSSRGRWRRSWPASTDPAQRATLYGLAFAVVRADEQVGGAERIYLAQLANLLGLDPATVQQLEAAAARRSTPRPKRERLGPG